MSLASALARLSPSDRDLLGLRYGADLGTREIARVLEMRANAVDVALSRARMRLRELLEAETSQEPARTGEIADEPL